MPLEIFQITPIEWFLVSLCAVLVGFAKTGINGAGILVVPIFASVFPAKESAGILLPMLCVADILAVWYYRRHAQWSKLWALFPWVVVGIIFATFLANQLSNDHIKKVIGVIVLSIIVLSLFVKKINFDGLNTTNRTIVSGVTGLSGGVATMLANAAGPIMNTYLLLMKLPKNEFIGTGSWFFLIVNFFKIPFMLSLGSMNQHSLTFNAKMIPLILFGGFLGIQLVKWIPEKAFKRVVLILTILAALKLLL